MMQLIEFLAVVSAGIYGALLARRKEMDFVGVFSVAFVTAFGGGTLRDLLLDRTPAPTEKQIRTWMAGNLCRCTGYDKIVRAILAAAEALAGEKGEVSA